ncbi:uncharacterized protein LOC112093913 [Morus notabilis]|uniref:uncharacterized protein LOC112093913 n=1 Tax=Morus notabilis TaxID=981085 RepID=UPI000CECEAAD|nr:uncharacterized protein LOC112093913 [Morus notabilis]
MRVTFLLLTHIPSGVLNGRTSLAVEVEFPQAEDDSVKGKLAPRYIGPFQIVQHVGVVAYRLTLLPELSHVHNVFQISMLRKHKPDPEAIVQLYDVPIKYGTTYEEVLVQILDRKMKSLRCHEISLVKVLWQHHGIEEAT